MERRGLNTRRGVERGRRRLLVESDVHGELNVRGELHAFGLLEGDGVDGGGMHWHRVARGRDVGTFHGGEI